MRPFWRTTGPGLPYAVSLSMHQSLICGADLPDQVAALQTRPNWQLGVLRKRLWQFGIERATDLFFHQQVPVSTLSWAGGFTGTLGFRFHEAVDDALIAIEEADRIGAETLVIAPGGQGTFTYRHARRMAIDGVQRIVGAAADRQLKLAILVDFGAPSSSRSLIRNWKAAAEFLDDIGSAHVGLAAPLPKMFHDATDDHPWEAYAAKLFVVTSPIEAGSSTNRVAATSSTVDEPAATLERLCGAGFRGTWECAAPALTPQWWNGREALLHCSAWVNNVARQRRRMLAG
ncbi:MAG TPA: TIM barrel protein [Planctomycetaceae bacterium]|nr:TIM barrel protein [Planctomycetaceae bacterium]